MKIWDQVCIRAGSYDFIMTGDGYFKTPSMRKRSSVSEIVSMCGEMGIEFLMKYGNYRNRK